MIGWTFLPSTTVERIYIILSHTNNRSYNCQWMVFDMKLYEPGQTLQANTFWIIEQVPGYTHSYTYKLM